VIILKKFIPKEKLSKKVKKSENKKMRKTWGARNPVTRKPPNPKAYNRKKVQKGVDYNLRFEPFYII
jgi:hypothetical protein